MTSWTRTVAVSFAVLLLAAAGCASPQPEPGPAADATTPGTPGSPAVVVEVTIRGGEVQTANDRVEVALGNLVRLVILSDTNDELHVHGYDLKRPLRAGEKLTLEFVADIPGVFEVELEDTGLALFELRVQ